MIELLFQIIGELLLQVAGAVLVELGFHALSEPFRTPPNPWLAAIGYFLFGAIFGGISLLIVSSYLVTDPKWRIINLIVTPLTVGILMSVIGRWRARRGQDVLRIDRFAYGYLFALSFALIRFWFAK